MSDTLNKDGEGCGGGAGTGWTQPGSATTGLQPYDQHKGKKRRRYMGVLLQRGPVVLDPVAALAKTDGRAGRDADGDGKLNERDSHQGRRILQHQGNIPKEATRLTSVNVVERQHVSDGAVDRAGMLAPKAHRPDAKLRGPRGDLQAKTPGRTHDTIFQPRAIRFRHGDQEMENDATRGTRIRQATLRHEHGHAVDAALGRGGKFLSNHPNFKRAFGRDVDSALKAHENNPKAPEHARQAFGGLRQSMQQNRRLNLNAATASTFVGYWAGNPQEAFAEGYRRILGQLRPLRSRGPDLFTHGEQVVQHNFGLGIKAKHTERLVRQVLARAGMRVLKWDEPEDLLKQDGRAGRDGDGDGKLHEKDGGEAGFSGGQHATQLTVGNAVSALGATAGTTLGALAMAKPAAAAGKKIEAFSRLASRGLAGQAATAASVASSRGGLLGSMLGNDAAGAARLTGQATRLQGKMYGRMGRGLVGGLGALVGMGLGGMIGDTVGDAVGRKAYRATTGDTSGEDSYRAGSIAGGLAGTLLGSVGEFGGGMGRKFRNRPGTRFGRSLLLGTAGAVAGEVAGNFFDRRTGMSRVVLGSQEYARPIFGIDVQKADGLPSTTSQQTEMSMDTTLDQMLDALRTSVVSILKVAPDEREGLLNKSLDQFGEAIAHEITVGAEMAFDAGLNADMLKLAESGDLAKGMNHVAGFALLLRQVEFFVETWASELEDDAGQGDPAGQGAPVGPGGPMDQGGGVQPPKPLIAAAQWYSMGQQILKAIVNDANGEGDDEEAGAPVEGEEAGAEGVPPEEAPAEEAPAEKPAAPPAEKPAAPPPEKPAAPPAEKPNPFEKKKEDEAAKAAPAGDLAKSGVDAEVLKVLAETQKTLAKLAADNAVLQKQVSNLSAQPQQSKGVLKVVGKNEDSLAKDSGMDLEAEATRLDKLTPENRAIELIKVAQRNPRPYTGNR